MGELTDFYEEISQASKNKRLKENIFIKKLGKPTLFIPNPEPFNEKDKSGKGYWRVQGGVIEYYIHPSGWLNLNTRQEFTDVFIQQLTDLTKSKPKR